MAGSVYADAALLAMIESVNVVVADEVKDGCLLNASGIKARLSATLERSGIHVAETSRWYLHVSLIGRPTIHGGRREGCVVDSYYQLTSYGPANTRIVAGEGGFLSIGPDAQDSAAMQSTAGFGGRGDRGHPRRTADGRRIRRVGSAVLVHAQATCCARGWSSGVR
jgi:hypothetical protein